MSGRIYNVRFFHWNDMWKQKRQKEAKRAKTLIGLFCPFCFFCFLLAFRPEG
jgi:hypothetical protein